MRHLVITITAGGLLASFNAVAAFYYVDSQAGQASDEGPGTLEQPWKTLARVGEARLRPGDIVNLHCDRTWSEQLTLTESGTTAAPIIVRSYGSCVTPPTIEGVDWLSSAWTRQDDSRPVYSHDAPFASATLVLFRPRGKAELHWLSVAQHPNATTATRNPYLNIVERHGNTELVAGSDLIIPGGESLVGARIYVRNAPWLIQQSSVRAVQEPDASHRRRIAINPPLGMPPAGFGYFFDGLRWMLDSEGEWIYEHGRLFVWKPGGGAPADGEIGLGARRYGIELRGASHVVVDGLRIIGTQTAIAASGTAGVTIRRCRIEYTADRAIDLERASGAIISGCVIERTVKEAVFAPNADAIAVEDNVISDTGNVGAPRRGLGAVLVDNTSRGDLDSIGASRVVNNVISGCGSICIRFGRKTLIADNRVKRSCVVLEDCGAIYAYNAVRPAVPLDSVVENNSIDQVVGNHNGRPADLDSILVGIYLDNDVQGVQVRGNRITDVDIGVLLHNAFDNVVTRNVLRGIRRRGIHLSETAQNSRQGADLVTGNVISLNEVGSPQQGEVIRLTSSLGDTEDFGRINGNREIDRAVPVLRTSGENLLSTPKDGPGPAKWHVSSRESARFRIPTCTDPGRDCVGLAGTGDRVPVALVSNGFDIRKGLRYRLRFAIRWLGDDQQLRVTVRDGCSSPYRSLGLSQGLLAGSDWAEHELVFTGRDDIYRCAHLYFEAAAPEIGFEVADVRLEPENVDSVPRSPKAVDVS